VKGWKALWQNLVGALALCVLTMCLTAKGRCVFPYPNSTQTSLKNYVIIVLLYLLSKQLKQKSIIEFR
tara:strand:- start:188 stop:391 length:204 start_codon:yes stop_codon:yes gene_type:complete